MSLVSFFQVKLTGTLPDNEAPGNPIEATLFGLLCVRHSASHFVSTGMLVLLLHYDKRGDQSIDANMINAAAIFVKSTWYSMKRLA